MFIYFTFSVFLNDHEINDNKNQFGRLRLWYSVEKVLGVVKSGYVN